MSNDISKIGAAAIAALKALTAAKAAKKTKTAKANELIDERNEAVRPLLREVHDLIMGGTPIDDCSTWKAWAKHAGWSKRALDYILNGRKPQGGNSSSRKLLRELLDVINCAPDIHVIRVAAAMIMDEIKYTPKTTVEVDGKQYETDADRTIDPRQFTKFVETVHIRYSPRKALCQTRFINRKIKGAVYAKPGEEEVTCADCIAVRDKTLGEGTLAEARERALAKKQTAKVLTEDGSESTDIRVRLTSAQCRETKQIAMELGIGWSPAVTLVFEAAEYQSQAKELVVALEKKITDLHDANREWRNHQNVTRLSDLLDWNNQSDEAKATKQIVSTYKGAVKACEGAIRAIIAGDLNDDDDPTRHTREWYEGEHAEEVERRAEETYQKRIAELDAKRGGDDKLAQLSESAKALAAVLKVTLKPTVEGAPGTKLRIEAQKALGAAMEAKYGEGKKVSKKVYKRISAGLDKYKEYLNSQQPPMPERPENAIAKTQHELTGNGCHMIAETSPEYDAWVAATQVASQTPEHQAWLKERNAICELDLKLSQAYDPVLESDLNGDDDDDPTGSYQEQL